MPQSPALEPRPAPESKVLAELSATAAVDERHTMPVVFTHEGRMLQAHFSVDDLGVYIESRGGSAGRVTWNADYNLGLETILARLGEIDAVLLDATLASRSSIGLSDSDRRLDLQTPYPLQLSDVDPRETRLRIARAQREVGRQVGARGPGNNTRRIRLVVEHGLGSPSLLEEWLGLGFRDEPAESHRLIEALARGTGQAYASDPELRRAVEIRAMEVASLALKSQQWDVRDVSATEPFDLECQRGSDALHVEVKGTRGDAEQVLVTANEVRHARSCPLAAIAIVSGITVSNTEANKATGGRLEMVAPWQVDEVDLTPLAYSWRPPRS